MSSRDSDRISSAQQTLDSKLDSAILSERTFNPRSVLHDISQLLNTRLDKETLATCVSMIESGVNPEALAAVIQELRREGANLNAQANANGRG
ncbi:mitotic-spindle organizing gamma-tubulin ring associated-domain-containing protein [Cristinia sonorae]|uniref:Mitotic-spindle organizing protein 1 n=1 Tax=Cristinia sonorae TaxID=1940300 RepID=A0A8K0XSH9_9AGAR|nr:mitotic-spindle organizing gamma-tubulin ring associated-domain-containing protein [Cristinia sonorae]